MDKIDVEVVEGEREGLFLESAKGQRDLWLKMRS